MSLKPRMLQKPVPSLWGCCKWCGDNLVLAIKAREGITPRLAGGAILLGLLLLVLQWFGVRVPFSAENAVSALSSGLLVWGSFYVFIWAPYKGIQELTYRNRLLVEKRFKIECGEMTTKRDCSIALFESDANTGIILRRYRVGIAFFGFRLINLGATTATNCRATLVGIEKDSVSICSDCGALPFEAKNPGDDLEMVNIPNAVPQLVSVCSVFHNNEVAAGSGNVKWRHNRIHPLFEKHGHGKYDFVIMISDETVGAELKQTQTERFTFHWTGNFQNCSIEHTVSQAA